MQYQVTIKETKNYFIEAESAEDAEKKYKSLPYLTAYGYLADPDWLIEIEAESELTVELSLWQSTTL